MTILGPICWVFCFLFMHRISKRQDRMLQELQEQNRQMQEQNRRIEALSKEEHRLIKEVHPQVSEIHQGVNAVITAVHESSPEKPPPNEKDA